MNTIVIANPAAFRSYISNKKIIELRNINFYVT